MIEQARGALVPDAWRRAGSVVAIIGLGKSGVAAARFLAREGVRVYASDASDHPYAGAAAEALKGVPWVDVEIGRHDLNKIRQAAGVVVSPGVPPDAPALAAARHAGVEIVSELDLGFRALAALQPGTRSIAITGTNGKTTTTALVAHLLNAAGLQSTTAGNIGRPVTDLAMAQERFQWLSLEVSSFQLHDSPHFAPEIGVLTNLAPDHLDRYPSAEAYYADKRLLFRNASAGDVWVLNADDNLVLDLARGVAGRRVLFSLAKSADAWYDAHRVLRIGGEPLIEREELLLLGDHNVANALAAALAVHAAGVPASLIGKGLRSFQPLPHRLEPVREVGGVLWINDSKATNIAATTVAVIAMRRPFVLLLGGRHKGEPYTSLAPLLAPPGRCRLVIAYGEAGPLVEQDLKGKVPLERGTTFEDVVGRARRAARKGDAVLLSPACSSYDMFKNYEERGATFRRLVEAQ